VITKVEYYDFYNNTVNAFFLLFSSKNLKSVKILDTSVCNFFTIHVFGGAKVDKTAPMTLHLYRQELKPAPILHYKPLQSDMNMEQQAFIFSATIIAIVILTCVTSLIGLCF